jgi:WD40 repeat protein/serine/threonine protein kinase
MIRRSLSSWPQPANKSMTDNHPDDDRIEQQIQRLAALEDESSQNAASSEHDSTIKSLKSELDTLLSELKQPAPVAEYDNESGLRRAAEIVRAIGRDPSFSPELAQEGEGQSDLEVEALGQYKLLAKLGEGGMGAVYKALHTRLDKVVALKVLPADRLQNADAVSRFDREMKAVGKLNHANIVAAHDAGEIDGMHYLVMELVDGIDLSNLVRCTGRLEYPDACELIRQAAIGLQHAHKRNMVHRDIKPSNLMLARTEDSEPVVKVLDMGLALLDDQHSPVARDLTTTGQMMGTLDYMAPEQGTDSHSVDIRADIYSLGATFYKLLTGHPPFCGQQYNTPIKMLTALATQDAPSISSQRDDLPPELVAVVDRMLAKSPDARFATPQEVANALAPLTADSDLTALLAAATSDDSSTRVDESAVGTRDHITSGSQDTAEAVQPAATLEQTMPATKSWAAQAEPKPKPSLKSSKRVNKFWLIGTALSLFVLAGITAGILFKIQTPDGTIWLTGDPNALEGAEVFVDEQHVLTIKGMDDPRAIKISIDKLKGKLRVEKDGFVAFSKEFDLALREDRKPITVSFGKVVARNHKPATTKFALDASDDEGHVELPFAWPHTKPITVEMYVTPEQPMDDRISRRLWQANGFELKQFNKHWVLSASPIVEGTDEQKTLSARDPVRIGHRTHLAGMFTADEMLLFVDGKLVGRKPLPGPLPQGSHPMYLFSARYDEQGRYLPFVGTIDDARISFAARYDADFVLPNHHEVDPETEAIYHFNEGQGGKLIDSSGNDHHGKIVGAKWVPANEDPNRRVAEWVLETGGIAGISVENEAIFVSPQEKLPHRPFRLVHVDFDMNQNVTDGDLARLEGLRDLEHLDLDHTKLSHRGIEHLRRLSSLSYLSLNYCPITNAGLADLADLKQLNSLYLMSADISNDGLRHIANFAELEYLSLAFNDITDRGLSHLIELGRLEQLYLDGLPISDDGLQHLKTHTNLRILSLHACPRVSDAGLKHLVQLKNLRLLDLRRTNVTSAGLTGLNALQHLETLNLDSTAVSDTGLHQLAGLNHLTVLSLTDTSVTVVGIAKLKLALPDCQIESDFTDEELAAAMAKIQDESASSVQLEKKLTGNTQPVRAVEWLSDGKHVLSASGDDTVKLWHVETAEVVREWEHGGGTYAMSAWGDGRKVLTGSHTGRVALWDTKTGETVKSFDIDSSSTGALEWHFAGERFLTGGLSGEIIFWDAKFGKRIREFKGHTTRVGALGFVRNNEFISGDNHGNLIWWNQDTGEEVRRIDKAHRYNINAITPLPDGWRFVSCGKEVRLWDSPTGDLIREFKGHSLDISSAVVVPGGDYLVTGGDDGTIRVWEIETGKQVHLIDTGSWNSRHLDVSPDGQFVISGGGYRVINKTETDGDYDLRIWRLPDHIAIKPDGKQLVGHWGYVRDLEFLPDGQLLSVGWDGILRQWDVDSGTQAASFEGHRNPTVNQVAVTSDGRTAATGGSSNDVVIWDLTSGQQRHSLSVTGSPSAASALEFTPNGKQLLVGHGDGMLTMFDVASGDKLKEIRAHDTASTAMIFLPDGKSFITAHGGGQVKVWDIASDSPKLEFTDPTELPRQIELLPNARYALICGIDIVRLWDLTTGKEVKTFDKARPAISIALLPGGRQFLAGCADKTVRLVNTETGDLIHTWKLPTHSNNLLAIDPSGRHFAHGGGGYHLNRFRLVGDYSVYVQEMPQP